MNESSSLIKPAFDNCVSICMVSSEEYSIFVAVTIESIIESASPERKYDLLVLSADMSEQNQMLLKSLTTKVDNVSLRFINISSIVEGKTFFTWAHFTKHTYFRLLIPYILEDYDKIIYLDSDVVVNKDIANLYDLDVSEYLLAAARDTHVIGSASEKCPYRVDYYKEELSLKNVKDYFQGGVVLYNLKNMRLAFPDWYLLKKATSSTYRWFDQDILNVECEGRVKIIENKWNVMTFNNLTSVDEQYLDDELYKEYMDAKKDPWIIHYVGRSMPCFTPYGDLYWYYWNYAKNTPYYEILLSTMMDLKIGEYEHKLKMSTIKQGKVHSYLNKILPYGTRRRRIIDKIRGK